MTAATNPLERTLPPAGLTSAQAAALLAQYGTNELPCRKRRPLWRLLGKFWGAVPLMLEVSAVLEGLLGRWNEVFIIAALLVVNAVVSFLTEDRAQRAMELLRSHLTMMARVLRDGSWREASARELVPGDVVRIRVGDVLSADVCVREGELLLNQAALTGESLPVPSRGGDAAFAGSIVLQGEATAEVTATGVATKFGRTAELVAASHRRSNLSALVLRIVRALLIFDLLLVAVILAFAWFGSMPFRGALLFAAALLIAAVPVALPATFTLAAAVGSLDLTKRGIFVTHLPSIEDAAAMDVLCCDKTGTLTENRLTVASVHANAGYSERVLLVFAAACSDISTQDPLDLAILSAAEAAPFERCSFVPFSPTTKRSEASIRFGGKTLRLLKGAPSVLATLTQSSEDWRQEVDRLAADGSRVLAVAASVPDSETELRLAGFIALRDVLRPDSRAALEALHRLGVQLKMVSGDGIATAAAVARNLGLGQKLLDASTHTAENLQDYDVIAGIYPEGKHTLVTELQQAGHVVGMTGDGVNDAPALRQADVGIAVANATDVAKAAAALVLTTPGLSSVALVIENGRRIYQRMLTYTLNKLVKTVHVSIFLTVGLLWLRDFVVRPRHVLLLLLCNDLVTMSIATDRVQPSPHPDRWDVGALLRASLPLALFWTVFTLAAVLCAQKLWHLSLPAVQTVAFLALVFSAQANVYLVRMRTSGWGSQPAPLMLGGTALALLGASALAATGTLTARIPVVYVAALFIATALVLALMQGTRSLHHRRFAAWGSR